MSKMNEQTDRRRVRRPFSPEELTLLIQAAEQGPVFQCIPGPDRAVLYIVGAYTGYRRGEIGSVTMRSFDFDSDPPTLSVEAGHSKHRRTDLLPLRQDFADRIRDRIASKPGLSPDQPLFEIADRRTADMVRIDLEAARAKWIDEARTEDERQECEASSFLKYVDEDGHYADFHALRNTFITNLSRADVSPKMAQTLARHSTIDLTMNTYTRLGVLDQAAAVESLPPLPGSKQPVCAKRRAS
jgi:integrase